MNLFENRNLIIATKHAKEQVIAPIFTEKLGVNCFVDPQFDTDILGTFTGEIERKTDPITTVREKCLAAMKQNNCDLGIASEGSFGPHPAIFFCKANEEILIFIDLKNELEIIVREIYTETNFNGQEIHSYNELEKFAKSVNFPSHGLIFKDEEINSKNCIKDITDWNSLQTTFTYYQSNFQKLIVETDMRAHRNPTRMKNIERTAHKLIDVILNPCPTCQQPGFSISSLQKGLPCSLCNLPTESILYQLFECKRCQFKEKKYYPRGIEREDPMYCNYCNP